MRGPSQRGAHVDLTTAESRNAADDTIANGGGTFDAVTLEPVRPIVLGGIVDGYAVGGIIAGRTLPIVQGRYSIAIAILSQRAIMAQRGIVGGYIGTWIDGETVYVDTVIILPDRASALTLARALGERAVYAFADGVSVAA